MARHNRPKRYISRDLRDDSIRYAVVQLQMPFTTDARCARRRARLAVCGGIARHAGRTIWAGWHNNWRNRRNNAATTRLAAAIPDVSARHSGNEQIGDRRGERGCVQLYAQGKGTLLQFAQHIRLAEHRNLQADSKIDLAVNQPFTRPGWNGQSSLFLACQSGMLPFTGMTQLIWKKTVCSTLRWQRRVKNCRCISCAMRTRQARA